MRGFPAVTSSPEGSSNSPRSCLSIGLFNLPCLFWTGLLWPEWRQALTVLSHEQGVPCWKCPGAVRQAVFVQVAKQHVNIYLRAWPAFMRCFGRQLHPLRGPTVSPQLLQHFPVACCGLRRTALRRGKPEHATVRSHRPEWACRSQAVF